MPGRNVQTKPVTESRGRSSITDVIRDFRRGQVITAARFLFGERGSIDVSMEEIAAAAGVSRSTLYNHFATREDVLVACLSEGQARLLAKIGAALAAVDDPVERLTTFLDVSIVHVDESPAFFRLMTSFTGNAQRGAEAASLEMDTTAQQMGELLRSIIGDGVQRGWFSTDVDHAVQVIGFVLVGILHERNRNQGSSSSIALAREVVGLLVAGLGRPRKLKARAKPLSAAIPRMTRKNRR
jgi:AcrR family transcriptional regulator